MKSVSILAALLVLLQAVTLAQVELDAKTRRAIQETEQEIATAREEAMTARFALQDDYDSLAQLFDLARAGRDVKIARDLQRILEEPYKQAEGSSLDRLRKRRKFQRALTLAARKAEHPLLAAMKEAIPGAVDAAITTLKEADQDSPSLEEFSDATLAQLLPADKPFFEHWNGVLHQQAPSRGAWVQAATKLAELESKLMVLKDPKMRFTIGAPAGMALVEGSGVVVESEYGFKVPKRRARVKDFYIDLHEVTHGEYWSRFWVNLEDKAKKQAYLPFYKDRREQYPLWVQDDETGEYAPLPEMMNRPVTGIDAEAAIAFALSQGKRLPTEAEWIAAATAKPGTTSLYPWGDVYAAGLANDGRAGLKTTREINQVPRGRSFYGIHDMSGNVKEWTATNSKGRDIDQNELPEGVQLTVRGGGFASSETDVSLKWRWQLPARNTRENDIGFRCAKDVD